MRAVVCGGGVIGAATALFLARRGVAVTLVERTGLANAASGKSGGFLALDWCDGTPLQALARRSFALHAALAGETGTDWGYRRMTTYAGTAAAVHTDTREAGLPWLSPGVAIHQRLGSTETTAQVIPAQFTEGMARAAGAAGATVKIGAVGGIALAEEGARVTGVIVGDETIPADAVVIAMGPWSMLAAKWLPLPAVYGLKGHSLVFATGTEVPPEALFLEYQDSDGTAFSPEVFPRTDGTTYVCAISRQPPLPADPADVAPDPDAIARLEAACRRLSPLLRHSPIVARQACFRPITQDGLPLIGAIPGIGGAYVATGHSVWGILNAPATGEAVAELIVDGGSRSVDLAPFDPVDQDIHLGRG